MAHESTYRLKLGNVVLLNYGDLIESELVLSRAIAAPQVTRPLRAAFARLHQGTGATHTLNVSVRREFSTLAAARQYQFARPLAMPIGGETLVIEYISGDHETTLIEAHLTSHSIEHERGNAFPLIETYTIIGGAYASTGTAADPADPASPAEPELIPVGDWILANGAWNDAGVWRDEAAWNDN